MKCDIISFLSISVQFLFPTVKVTKNWMILPCTSGWKREKDLKLISQMMETEKVVTRRFEYDDNGKQSKDE